MDFGIELFYNENYLHECGNEHHVGPLLGMAYKEGDYYGKWITIRVNGDLKVYQIIQNFFRQGCVEIEHDDDRYQNKVIVGVDAISEYVKTAKEKYRQYIKETLIDLSYIQLKSRFITIEEGERKYYFCAYALREIFGYILSDEQLKRLETYRKTLEKIAEMEKARQEANKNLNYDWIDDCIPRIQ